MDHDGSEDLLDDADFETLPPGTLAALELAASGRPGAMTQTIDVEELPDAESDYGLDDEDVIDLDAQPTKLPEIPRNKTTALDEVTQRERWRQERYGGAAPQTANLVQQPPTTKQHLSAVSSNTNGEATDVASLQARIAELERSQAALQKASENAQSATLAKAGEIAIVRANQEKAVREYERKMAVLQALHAEETAKYRAQLDAAYRDREKVETNNRFLEHDLAQEAERARGARKILKDGQSSINRAEQASPVTTPKKAKMLPLRDGFNDDEVVVISPSKKKDRSKPSTPKGGAKRKRNALATDSPSRPLSFTETETDPDKDAVSFGNDDTEAGQLQQPTRITLPIRVQDKKADAKFDFVQLVLGHRIRDGHSRAVEELTRYAIPSAPSVPLSSKIYDACNSSTGQRSAADFRKSFCITLTDIWSKCLEEHYYGPIPILLDMLSESLLLSSNDLTSSIVRELVPKCMATADLVALARAKASKAPASNQPPSAELCKDIDPSDCLEFLQQIATDCEPESGARKAFWTAMEHSFVLLMLHKAQPLPQISLMLHLLATSILEGSFGAVASPSKDGNGEASVSQRQAKHESEIIDRLTVLLFDVPVTLMQSKTMDGESDALLEGDRRNNEKAAAIEDLLMMRLTVLGLLKRLCFTRHGGHALATHRRAIGRLVRLLHENVVMMYGQYPTTHDLTTAIVNQSVALLAHLTSEHAKVVDMRARLAAEPSGAYKHLVALARVAFAEGASYIEAGVTTDAQDMAHRMLDEMLSPDEGEAVMNVFSSARG